MKDLVVLVPTRNRPQNIRDLKSCFEFTEATSDLIAVVDDDDEMLLTSDGYMNSGVEICVVKKEGKGMARPLNESARRYQDDYRYFCFMGDDHRPRTKNWDQKFVGELQKLKTGLVYGNDLHQGHRLPTAVAMTSDIVKALGGMVPSGMIHLYVDNFWLRLGKDIQSISYLSDVVIEHMHPDARKAEWTEQYRSVNSADVYSADRSAMENYLNSKEYKKLLSKISI